jgi:endo-1,4-beta-D-glucanase Y
MPDWRIGILAVATSAFIATASWNLPYQQGDRYDYSAWYHADINSYLSAVPNLFKSEMTKGWRYYKEHFLMANGLVNHQRKDAHGDNVIGRDEAVSEGQGYGMLLALLCNDQETFNRIFEAANQYLWDTGRQSYFCWRWQGGCTGQGAATDADLDIGLALVFADKLQEHGFWNAYANNGVTYRSRAMEIIGSIRTNMTSNDYLLPGDNWGASGINNLNPSYFAVAWLKVFNAYQDQYDFTAVIDKCYEVIEAMPHYNKGQAANWITPSGGRASFGGLDMGADGIRTPWRIAMDALWFDDSRARQFCANSKRTLTQYASSSSSDILEQMGYYNEQGALITDPGNRGTCGEIAMWACAIVGSKDPAYATKGMNGTVLTNIIGGAGSGSADHFGSASLKDELYYYKQSIAMLGFAAIAGQFPNVLADLDDGVAPPEPVKLTSGLSASAASVSLPGTVTFSATLDKAAPWTLTLTGMSTGKTETLSGQTAAVSATWTGSGWYDIETVEAALFVTGLDEATDPQQLAVSVAITAVPDRPAIEPGATLMVHDLENNSTINAWGGAWYVYTDKSANGTSTTDPADAVDLAAANAGSPGAGIAVSFAVDQFAGVGMNLTAEGETLDLSPFASISFDYKTDGLTRVQFMLATANITNYAYSQVMLPSTNGQWQTRTVAMNELMAPSWSPGVDKDPSVSEKIQWQIGQGDNGTLWLDNISMTLETGRLPGEDIMTLIDGSDVRRASAVIIAEASLRAIRAAGGLIHIAGIPDQPRAVRLYGADGRCAAQCAIHGEPGQWVAEPVRSLAPGAYVAWILWRGGVSRTVRLPAGFALR